MAEPTQADEFSGMDVWTKDGITYRWPKSVDVHIPGRFRSNDPLMPFVTADTAFPKHWWACNLNSCGRFFDTAEGRDAHESSTGHSYNDPANFVAPKLNRLRSWWSGNAKTAEVAACFLALGYGMGLMTASAIVTWLS